MCLVGGGDCDCDCCCSDDDDDGVVQSFNDKGGKGSVDVVWFKLRSASFEDGGTGTTGMGRMRIEEEDDAAVRFFNTIT